MSEIQNKIAEFVQFSVQLKKLGTELCTIRKQINHSQIDMADWVGCDRRKIAEIEAGECQDFELIFTYANRLSIEIKLTFEIY